MFVESRRLNGPDETKDWLIPEGIHALYPGGFQMSVCTMVPANLLGVPRLADLNC